MTVTITVITNVVYEILNHLESVRDRLKQNMVVKKKANLQKFLEKPSSTKFITFSFVRLLSWFSEMASSSNVEQFLLKKIRLEHMKKLSNFKSQINLTVVQFTSSWPICIEIYTYLLILRKYLKEKIMKVVKEI